MPVDPPPDFDPIRAQYEHNVEMIGFANAGEIAERLEREQAAIEVRHDAQPGGGVRVLRVPDPADLADVLLDREARMRALTEGARPQPTTKPEVEKTGKKEHVTLRTRAFPAIPDRGW